MCASDAGREQANPPGYGDQAELTVQGGPDNGKTIPLTSTTVTLGRQSDSGVVLDEPAVSRRHATIETTPSGYLLRDLGSTNGTFVNRQRIAAGGQILNHGDLIRLGGSTTVLMFRQISAGDRTLRLSIVESEPSSKTIRVDARARQVFVRGRLLDPPLPKKEFDLLMLLDSRRGEAVNRDEMAAQVWPERPNGDVGNHEIEQCVHRVRMRIEADTSKPEYLITIRGFGYKLV